MIELVISGGQSGADQAGWRAAKAAGIPTGGFMPRGFKTEDGPRPEFAELYGAKEMPTADYGLRTDANVREADWVVWFGNQNSRGGRRTIRAAELYGPGWFGVDSPEDLCVDPGGIARCLLKHKCRKLMVAGNRESSSPGIGA